MSDKLFLGDYSYSSWSLRAWLLFHRFGIPATIEIVQGSTMARARTVEAMSKR